MRIVYADVLILINFSMDFLILTVCCKLLKAPLKLVRIMMSALIGAFYSLLEFLWTPDSKALPIILNIIVSYIMCSIVIQGKRSTRFLATALFYAVCFATGGGIAALYSLSGSVYDVSASGASYYYDISIIDISILSIVVLVVTFLVNKLIKRKQSIRTASVKLRLGGALFECCALVDSGCLVREPITETDVVFVKSYQEIGRENTKICFIPVNTLTGRKLFEGVWPDEFYCNGEQKKVVVVFCRDDSLSFGEYDAIIPTSIV